MSDTTSVAVIGFCGVALAALVQWLVAQYTVRKEAERLRNQLAFEFNHQQLSEWQNQFREVMSELLVAADPEVHAIPDKKVLVPLVLRAQLMLNPDLQAHATANALINQLVLRVNGWHGDHDAGAILGLHGQLLDISRKVMFRPRQ